MVRAFNGKTNWQIAEEDRAKTTAWSRALDVPHIVAHLLLQRGVESLPDARRFLAPSLSHLSDPRQLEDMGRAVERIRLARERGEQVLVFGDYDVDGIAGTAIMMNALSRFGLTGSSYALPNRLVEGYGLHASHVQQAAQTGVGLIITVDNGISSHEAAAAAREYGVDLIVTDHHAIEGSLPEAHAVLNPKRHDDTYAGLNVSGAAVAFKLACALTGEVEDLDLAALGTVADIVPLQGENRDLVAAGLKYMASRRRVGLVALAQAAGIRLDEVTSENIAFQLGPRINAGGRMGDAAKGVRLLLTESPAEANEIARELNSANEERRVVEQGILDEARERIDATLDAAQRTIVLAREDWHPGVLGVVASRLQSGYNRPVGLIAIDAQGEGRGSVRGIPGFDVMAALTSAKEHLRRFGGHRAAGGLALAAEDVDAFAAAFESAAVQQLPEGLPAPSLSIDALISLSEIDGRLMKSLDLLEPFGSGNPGPVFCTLGVAVMPRSARELRGGHVRFSVRQGGQAMNAIGFKMAESFPFYREEAFLDVAFSPRFNTWRDETTIQLVLKDFRMAGDE